MQPVPHVAQARPVHRGAAAIVDVETTGLRPSHDEIIELGLLLFAYDPACGDVIGIIDEYVGYREPSRPIPAEATAVHGITMEHVRGRVLDHQKVRSLLARAEFIIAHHAAFDRSFVMQLYPEVASRRWLCSLEGINWRRRGFTSRSLPVLLAAHGIRPVSVHRAGADCRATLTLLAHPLPDGTTYLYELLRRHRMLRPVRGGPCRHTDGAGSTGA